MKIFFTVCLSILCTGLLYAQDPPKSQLSTHMLDITLGKPAPNIPVTLYKWDQTEEKWESIFQGKTSDKGRIDELLTRTTENEGTYKLKFETKNYFQAQQLSSIYPYVEITFELRGKEHYHIPITMSANGFSTYRGN